MISQSPQFTTNNSVGEESVYIAPRLHTTSDSSTREHIVQTVAIGWCDQLWSLSLVYCNVSVDYKWLLLVAANIMSTHKTRYFIRGSMKFFKS